MAAAHTMSLLSDVGDLDRALAGSSSRPVLIFKHSPACGISVQAFEEMESLLAGRIPADVYLVDVWKGRPVSDAVAARLRTRHESPQVLLVHGGRVRWSASHFRVTARAIRSALADLAAPDIS